MSYMWMTDKRKEMILHALLEENWKWEDKAEASLRKGEREQSQAYMKRADEVHRIYLLLKES